MSNVTEFVELDPQEFHLVPEGATGFPVLLAKAAVEAVEAEMADDVEKFVSAEDRRKMAAEGVAMPDGAFPIADEGHLRSAIGRLAEYKGNKAAAKRHIIARARALHLTHLLPKEWNVSKDAAKEADPALPLREAESQTDKVDAGPEGPEPSPDPGDGGRPREVDFPHGSLHDGQGDTAPSKDTHQPEAESQTRADIEGNTAKAEGDGRGSILPDKDVDPSEEEGQTKDNEEGESMKASADSKPGSPAWEHKDVALGEKAERLVEELGAVVREFTEREKAEGGTASKAQWRVIRRVRSLLENPTILTKEFPEMSATEALKALDEAERARRDMKKAQNKEKAVKAAEKEAKAAKAAKKAAKASDPSEVTKAVDEKIDALRKEIDTLSARRPFVNGVGVTTALRGSPEAVAEVFKAYDVRVDAAQERLSKAGTEYDKLAAKAELESALRARTNAKLVAQANGQARGVVPPTRFGPNTTDLFGGSSLTLGNDDAIKGYSTPAR